MQTSYGACRRPNMRVSLPGETVLRVVEAVGAPRRYSAGNWRGARGRERGRREVQIPRLRSG
jgi:hypothetical protein